MTRRGWRFGVGHGRRNAGRLPPFRRPFSSAKIEPSVGNKDPLRILFCGADLFSASSLRALHQESTRAQSGIASIDVVTRKDKRTGRGLKEWTAPPIKAVAQELGLPLHQIDTFTGWNPPEFSTPPQSIDLVVTVSFGLLVPPES